jgi:DNA/RNA-binding domain of Phe-tRNA-synthetase-like protein
MGAAAVTGAELEPRQGWVAPEVRAEHPELRLLSLPVDARAGRSPPEVRQRLRHLSDRFRGAQAVALRRTPVPWAYRVFFRHIGLDPDVARTPIEAAAVERLLRGGWRSDNLLDDALTIALVETGVPLWALDAERVEGELGIRTATPGELLGRSAPEPAGLAGGRLVVADASAPLAVLFGELATSHGVRRETARMLLFTVAVAGIPQIHVEEALHSCASTLTGT